jgi:hypothetical protein
MDDEQIADHLTLCAFWCCFVRKSRILAWILFVVNIDW